MSFKLLLIQGKSTRELAFDAPSIRIGRSSEADISILDSEVSRMHCVLFFENGKYFIEDLASANGTFVGNSQISSNVKTLVKLGQQIRLGKKAAVLILQHLSIQAEPEVPPLPIMEFGDASKTIEISQILNFSSADPGSPSPSANVLSAPPAAPPSRVRESVDSSLKHAPLADEFQKLVSRSKDEADRFLAESKAEAEKVLREADQNVKEQRDQATRQITEMLSEAHQEVLALRLKSQEEANRIIQSAQSDSGKARREASEMLQKAAFEVREMQAKAMGDAERKAFDIIKEAQAEALRVKSLAMQEVEKINSDTRLHTKKMISEARDESEKIFTEAKLRSEARAEAVQKEASKILNEAQAAAQELLGKVESEISEEKEKIRREVLKEAQEKADEILRRAGDYESEIKKSTEDISIELERKEKERIHLVAELTRISEEYEKKKKQNDIFVEEKTKELELNHQKIKDEFAVAFNELKAQQENLENEKSSLLSITKSLKEEESKLKQTLDRQNAELASAALETKQMRDVLALDMHEKKKREEENLAQWRLNEEKRFKDLLKSEAQQIESQRKLQLVEFKNGVAFMLETQIKPFTQDPMTIEKVSKEIHHIADRVFSAVTEAQLPSQSHGPERKKFTQKYWMPLTATVMGFLVVFTYWGYQKALKSNHSEALAQKWAAERSARPVFAPKKDYEFKSTFADNILYTKNYAELKKENSINDLFVLGLNRLFIERLKLNDDAIVKYSSLEANLITQLSQLESQITFENQKEGIQKLRDYENQMRQQMVQVVGSERALKEIHDFEKRFLKPYFQAAEIADKGRLPAGSK